QQREGPGAWHQSHFVAVQPEHQRQGHEEDQRQQDALGGGAEVLPAGGQEQVVIGAEPGDADHGAPFRLLPSPRWGEGGGWGGVFCPPHPLPPSPAGRGEKEMRQLLFLTMRRVNQTSTHNRAITPSRNQSQNSCRRLSFESFSSNRPASSS